MNPAERLRDLAVDLEYARCWLRACGDNPSVEIQGRVLKRKEIEDLISTIKEEMQS